MLALHSPHPGVSPFPPELGMAVSEKLLEKAERSIRSASPFLATKRPHPTLLKEREENKLSDKIIQKPYLSHILTYFLCYH